MIVMCASDIVSVTCDLQPSANFFLTCASEDTDEGNQRTFTLEDAFNNTLKPKSYNLRWISGGRK